jgi:transposase
MEQAGIAGIDVHKAMLAVVVGREGLGERQWIRRKFGTTANEVRNLAAWLEEHHVERVVMESTAQYWRPVWLGLERQFVLHLAQPLSNAAPRGRKTDYADALRLVKRLMADELRLSFVPDAEQRQWRHLSRTRNRLLCDRVRLQNQIEALLEEGQIKLSAVVSDLFGVSGRRILAALAEGKSDPEQLAQLADGRLHATKEELVEALAGRLNPVYRTVLELHLERVALLDRQVERLEKELHTAQSAYQDTIRRLCAVPGVGLPVARQLLAELGPLADAFPSAGHLASWVGVCPGRKESAGVSTSDRSAKGNRAMRRVITQMAWAAIRVKGSLFEHLFRRWVPRLGPQQAIWATAHRLVRLIWKILHQGVEYVEYGPMLNPAAIERRKRRLVRELRKLGIPVEYSPLIA